jgi:hypothetical protein
MADGPGAAFSAPPAALGVEGPGGVRKSQLQIASGVSRLGTSRLFILHE